MDRVIVYSGQIPLDTNILLGQKNTLIGLSKLAHAMMGDGPWIKGLSCVPTAPASLQVQVNPGQIYMLENLDGTAYGSLAADITHQILKQGILMDAVTLSCPAPGTAGQSIAYLIEVGYLDTDGGSTVLPYYNSSNPALAYNGPNNTGTSQNTVRQGVCSVQVKAGTAAATGTQTVPAPDAGYIGAWVVTVANGQTTITAANIVLYGGVPMLVGTDRVTGIGNTTTLSVGNSGIHALLVTNGIVVTLWTPVGNQYTRAKFTGTDTNSQTITTPAGVIYLPDGTVTNSIILSNQDTIELVSDGTNWRVVDMHGFTVIKQAVNGNQAVTRDQGDARWMTATSAGSTFLKIANNLSDVPNAGLARLNILAAGIGANDNFASGTVMPFYQAAAPTGWTQVTTQNDKAMRVVSGAGGGSGGTVAFSAITSQNVAGHQLTVAEMPSHTHAVPATINGSGAGSMVQSATGTTTQPTGSTGGDGTHSHGVGFQPAYIDLIIASKN